MLSNAQMDLNAAVEDSLAAARKVAETSRDLQRELSELREMHSQLARLNVERQKTIAALADALANLYAIAAPFMRETDSVWRAMQDEYVAAMKLAEREPEI